MNHRVKDLLMNAVIGGNLTKVEETFNKHKLIFDETYFDYELLRASLKRRHHQIIYFLLENIGCRAGNPNKVNLEETPLHLAMKLDSLYVIQKIVRNGALIFAKDDKGEIPLYAGFKNRNLIACRTLLAYCKPNCKPNDENAILHFHIACVMNHIPAVNHYLKCGINPNNPLRLDFKEYSGLNPVQFAVEKNYNDLFHLLLCHGADLSIKNAKGLSPIHTIYYTSAENRKSRIKQVFESGNNTKFVNSVDRNGVSHFHLCCMFDQPLFVQKFINNKVNINNAISSECPINPCFTPLHFAVINGCEAVIKLLLENGADCNQKDKDEKTPLHYTYKLSKFLIENVINIFLNYQSNVAIADKEGNTPVHILFSYADYENKNILNTLLSKIPERINFTNDEGLSHFHIACAINNVSLVKHFLASDVNVDSCVTSGIYSGYTGLHFAVLRNQKDVVKLLLKKNAQVNIKTKVFQITPLHLSCKFNYSKFRIENPKIAILFPISIDSESNRTNQLDIIKLLLSHGAHVDAKDYQGMTPLLHACMIEKNYCNLDWTYNSNIYLNGLRREGLMKEIKTRLEEIIEILLCNKASAVAHSDTQKTILHIISQYNSLKLSEKIIKLILLKGANVNAVDNAGLTPLHVATEVGNKRMARIFLRQKANVNIKCENSKIPLHAVFKRVLSNNNERDIFCALLESGSDVNITDEEGRLILFDAIRTRNKFVVEKLLYYGADINMRGALNISCVIPLILVYEDRLGSGRIWHDYFYAEVFKVVYTHIQKLLALELYVSEQVQHWFNQLCSSYKHEFDGNPKLSADLDNIFCNCVKELEIMKLIKLDNYTSLYSILVKDYHEMSKHVRNKTLIKIIKARNLEKDFPLYSYLLKLQFKRGLIRSDLLQSAKESLTTILNIKFIPDLCFDFITKRLENKDVANLNAAVLLRKNLKRKLEDTNSNQNQSLQKRMHL